jgi:RHS repeat-associated protein
VSEDLLAAAKRIYVGWTDHAARNGIDTTKLGEEEWVVRTIGDYLVLTGGRPRTSIHSFSLFVSGEDWFDTHPEYFSLVSGRRVPARTSAGPGQLCLTNSDVLRLTVTKLREFIEADRAESAAAGVPGPKSYWITQNDVYDAFGLPIDFDPADALTSLLYSGEIFDQRIAIQYLRARYYDPASGTFNRLDPFVGRMQDPQSLHKYLYVHGDPVQGIDPSGLLTLSSTLCGISVSNILMAGGSAWLLNGLYAANQLGLIDTPTSESGVALGFVPYWGSGRNFLYHVNDGQYLSAMVDAALFITDFSIVKGLGKIGYRAWLQTWKQAVRPGVFWAVWGFPQKVFLNRAPNHFMWQVGKYVYDATLENGIMRVGRELATESATSGSYAIWKWRLPIPLPAIFREGANTCGATGGNCFTQMVTAMEAAGVPEAMQTIIKGVYLYGDGD